MAARGTENKVRRRRMRDAVRGGKLEKFRKRPRVLFDRTSFARRVKERVMFVQISFSSVRFIVILFEKLTIYVYANYTN